MVAQTLKTRLYEKLTAKLVDRYGSSIHSAFSDILDISKEEAIAISKNLRFKQYLNMSNALASGDVNTARSLATEAKERFDEFTAGSNRNPASYNQQNIGNVVKTGGYKTLGGGNYFGKKAPRPGAISANPSAVNQADIDAANAVLQKDQEQQNTRDMDLSTGTTGPAAAAQSPTAQGTDMDDEAPVLPIKQGDPLKVTGVDRTTGGEDGDIEITLPAGEKFKIPQAMVMSAKKEGIERLRRLAGI